MIKLKSLLKDDIQKHEQFEDWFKGSKVVGVSGKPKVLYHGTDKSIDNFSSSRMGKSSNIFGTWEIKRYGIFLSEDVELAKEFGSHIVSVYAKCYDPLDLRKSLTDAEFNTIESFVNTKGGNGFAFARFIDKRSTSSNTWKLFDEDEGYEPGKMIKIFKEMGYDGVLINEPSEKHLSSTVWVLFDPEQVWIINQGVV